MGLKMNSEKNVPIITINKDVSVWYLLSSKSQTNAKFYYHGKLIPQSINQVFRDKLIDYTALLNARKRDDKDENNEDYMLMGRVVYSLGWDLRHLSEIRKYKEMILKNDLALRLYVWALVNGEKEHTYEEVRIRRLELKEIIDKVEEEIDQQNLSENFSEKEL